MNDWELLAAAFGAGVGYVAAGVGGAWRSLRTVRRETDAEVEHVRDDEWAKTLAVAAEHGWPPYTALPGLSRSAELAWRETYLRTARHCSQVTMPDGRAEWIYTQPKEEQR